MFKKNSLLLLGIFLIIDVIYWLRIGGSNTVIIRDTAYLLTPLIATIAGIFSIRLYGLQGPRTKTLFLLTIGVGCWFAGESIFYSYEFIFHTNPFPSVADVFYLIAYPVLFSALFNEIRQIKINWKKIHPSIIFLFVISAIALGLLVLYFGVYLAYDSHETFFTNLIALGYGVGDLFLIIVDICVLILAWEFREGSFSYLWIQLFISFIFMLVADVLFAIFTSQYKAEVWFYRSLLDSLWMIAYLLFANGLFSFGFSIRDAKSQMQSVPLSGKKK